MWVRPGWRRHGSNLPRLMGYVANTVALARWGRQTAFSNVEVRQDRHKAIEAARRIYDVELAAATISGRPPRQPARPEMLPVAYGPDHRPGQMARVHSNTRRAPPPRARNPGRPNPPPPP